MNFSQIAHKNILVSGFIALVIISGGIYIKFFSQPHQENSLLTQDVGLSTSSPTSAEFTDRDTDGDGLPDWEERLYGSDPLKKDTDGDGTSDGAEVRQGRDPTKANTAKPGEPPNDKLTRLQDIHFATSSTDILGIKKEFFTKFLAKESRQIRETTYLDLLGSFDAKKYRPQVEFVGLDVTSDSSIEGLRAYGNAFGVLIQKYTVRAHRTEDEILNDVALTDLSTSTKSIALKELQLPAITYKNFADDLKSLKVPSTLAKPHLLIINGYMGMSQGLLDLQSLYDNPVIAAGGYEGYTSKRFDVTNGYVRILQIFAEKNVKFGMEEPGAPFYWRITHSTTTKR